MPRIPRTSKTQHLQEILIYPKYPLIFHESFTSKMLLREERHKKTKPRKLQRGFWVPSFQQI